MLYSTGLREPGLWVTGVFTAASGGETLQEEPSSGQVVVNTKILLSLQRVRDSLFCSQI